MQTDRSSDALTLMFTGSDYTAGSELRPDKSGAILRLVFLSLVLAAPSVALGYVTGISIRPTIQSAAVLIIAIGFAMVLNIVISQLAAQTLLSARFDDEGLTLQTLLSKRRIHTNEILAVYAAPNHKYTNLIIDTDSAPQLLSSAIWSRQSFAIVEDGLRRWAAAQGLQVTDVNTVWANTEVDRHARQLLLQCFREPYRVTLGVILSIAAASFLLTTLF